jgi:hypothetical protein
MQLKIYCIILLLQVITAYMINVYICNLNNENNGKSIECVDILNKTLYELKFCIWNICHIFIFFFYCVIMKPVTLLDHFYIFLIGVFLFILEIYIKTPISQNKKIECKCVTYTDLDKPRVDDLIFNTMGQILYVICLPVINYYINCYINC